TNVLDPTGRTNSLFPTTTIGNVDAIRMQGVELSADKNNVVKGVQLFGSVTWVDSRILSDPSFVSTIGGTTAVGKRVPNIPEWRAEGGGPHPPHASWGPTGGGGATRQQMSPLAIPATVPPADPASDTSQA